MPEFIDVLKALATDEKDETLKAKLEEVIEKLDGKDLDNSTFCTINLLDIRINQTEKNINHFSHKTWK